MNPMKSLDGKHLPLYVLPLILLGASGHACAEQIPDWVKNNAQWWSEDKIGDEEFVRTIEFLISRGAIAVDAGNAEPGTASQTGIPAWIKTNALLWSQDRITEGEFLAAIEFLVGKSIILTGAQPVSTARVFSVTAGDPMRAGSTVGMPGIAVDEFRNAIHVTYASTADERTDIFMTSSYDGGRTFEEPVLVNPVEGIVQRPFSGPAHVEAGPGGEIYVIFYVGRHGPPIANEGFEQGFTEMYLVRSDDGGKSFGDARLLGDAGSNWSDGEHTALQTKGFESLLADRRGNLFVSWISEYGNKGQMEHDAEVQVSRSYDGGLSFAPSGTVGRQPCECCATSLDTFSDGSLGIMYRKIFEGSGGTQYRDMVVSFSDDGGMTWSPPKPVSEDRFEINSCPTTATAMRIDGGDTVHAAWYTGGGEVPGLYYSATADRGESWTAPLLLDGSREWFPPTDITLSLDRQNRPTVAWADKTADGGLVKYATISGGQKSGNFDLGPGGSVQSDSGMGLTALVWEGRNEVRIKIIYDEDA